MATNEIVKSEPLHVFLRKPEVVEKFIGLFPNDTAANRYIQSVLILVQSSEPGDYSLMNCSNESILRSALRAVSLRVSVDPAVRQAWLVPRKNGKTGKVEASLQLHYSELRNRAMRTNRYSFINVSPVYEGCEVFENIYNGLHQVKLASGIMTAPSQQDGFVSVSERRGKVIGWLGYSRTTRGAEQTVYMSVADIEKHISTHNPYWSSSKAWKQNRSTMEQKTVLLALLRKSDLGDPALGEVREILSEGEAHDEETIDAVFEDEAAPVPAPAPGVVDPVDEDFPPLPADWQAAKTAKEAEQKKAAEQTVQAKPVATRPYPPEIFKQKFEAAVAIITEKNNLSGIGDGARKVVASAIDGIFSGEKTMRYEVCQWLTGHSSTKDMTPAQLKALMTIMGTSEFNVPPKPEAIQELRQAHAAALVEAGQGQLPLDAPGDDLPF